MDFCLGRQVMQLNCSLSFSLSLFHSRSLVMLSFLILLRGALLCIASFCSLAVLHEHTCPASYMCTYLSKVRSLIQQALVHPIQGADGVNPKTARHPEKRLAGIAPILCSPRSDINLCPIIPHIHSHTDHGSLQCLVTVVLSLLISYYSVE